MKTKQKRQSVKHRPRPKHKPRRRPAPEKKTEALTVYRRGQLMQPTKDEVRLIRDIAAKDANDQEFNVFMHLAKSSRLDPLKKEIYCLIFNKNDPEKRQMVVLTGIGGYCAIAAREYPNEFAGLGKPEFTFTSGRKTPKGRPIPDTCTIEIKCKDNISSWGFLNWDERVPYGDLKDERLKFWNNSPCDQLEKCTAAKGLRRRFPGLNNIYVDTELDRARSEETPGGRRFTVGGVRPDGSTPAGYLGKLDETAAHGHLPGSAQAEKAEAQLRKVEEADRKLAEGKTIDVTPEEKPKRKKKEPENPELGKVWPKGETAPPGMKPPKKRKTMAEMHGELFNGTVHRVLSSIAKNHAPKLDVQINRIHFSCFRRSIFEPLQACSDGDVIECYVKDGQIIGLKRINDQHFAEDGVTPIGREPGDE